MGVGGVTVIKPNGDLQRYTKSKSFLFSELGDFQRPDPVSGIPAEVWQAVQMRASEAPMPMPASEEVLALVETRQAARSRQDWRAADELRLRIEASGWQVQDTREGPVLQPL
jgi:cysteinyl-tRNA synthetase